MNTRDNLILVLLGILIVGTSVVAAFSGLEDACNSPTCHAYPPTTINVTADVTSTLTVNPGQAFTINVSWSGGNPGATAVKWPNNTGDNLLFNPTPHPLSTNPSGTQISNLIAPSAGDYNIRVFASRGTGSSGIAKETDFKNITVHVVPLAPAPTFNISGFKINSVTGLVVTGWAITLSNTTMTVLTTTDVNGMYQFTGLANGSYTVNETMQAGWTNVTPTSIIVSVAGADVPNQNFTNTPPTAPPSELGSISGNKIEDLNGNEIWDDGEKALSGWTIELKGIGAGNHEIEMVAITGDDGFYKFDELPAGKYLVKEKHQKGYIPSSSPVIIVSLAKGQSSEKNSFFNRPISSLKPQKNK